jgi:predicted Zn-dependent protease
MSRRFIWVTVVLAVFMVAGAAAAVAGFFLYRSYEDQQNLAQAEEYFEAGEWALAINHYRFYLSRNRTDLDALRKFAVANEHTLSRRRDSLKAAANAYYMIHTYEPDPALEDKVLEIYRRIRVWSDLEYYAGLFLRDRPGDPELQFMQALATDHMGRAADARRAYEDLIEAGTDNPAVYANLAGVLNRQGFPEQAREVLAALEQALPDNAASYVAISEYYLATGDVGRAERGVEKALTLDPEAAGALSIQAQLHLLQNRPEEALEYAERANAADPGDARGYLLKAVAHNRLQDRDAAIATLDAVDATLAVDQPEVLLALAESQISANRLADVEVTIARYRASYPEMRLTIEYIEGRKALAEGNAGQAVTKLTNVVDTNPGFSSAQYYLAVALLQSQQRERGRTALETYLRNNPEDEQAQKLLLSEFGGPQTLAEAQQQAQALVASSNDVEELFAAVRPLLNMRPGPDGAPREFNPVVVDVLEKVIQSDPTNERAYQSLTYYYTEFGEVAKARQVLERAQRAAVPADRLTMPRAAVLLTEGDAAGAEAAFADALDRQDFTVDKALAWGNLFANHDSVDAGLEALRQAAEKNVGGAAAIIELEKPLLLARHGEMDRALQTLDELSTKYATTSSVRQPLIDLKLQFAETLLQLPEDARREQGLDLLAQVEQTGSANPDLMLVRARDLLRQDPPNFTEATVVLDRALSVDRNNYHALMLLAQVYMQQGLAEQALAHARQAADVSAGNQNALLLVGRLLYELQRHRECQDTLESLLATHPDTLPAIEMLTESYMASGRTQLAQTWLDRLRHAAPEESRSARRLALLQSRLLVAQGRDLSEAERLLHTQYEADPTDISVLTDLARAIAGQGRTEEAARLVRTFANAHPTEPEGWYTLGQFYLDQNDQALVPDASAALTRALLIDPNYVPAMRSQIEVQARQGRPVETLQLADRYLAARPNDELVLFRKGAVLYQLNRMEEALEAVERALAITERPEYLYLRASVKLAQANFEEALADLQRVAPQGISTANFDMALAEAYWGVGETQLALQHFDSAKRKNRTDDPVAPERLRRFESRVQELPAL